MRPLAVLLVPAVLAPVVSGQSFGPDRLGTSVADYRSHATVVDLDQDGTPDVLWTESLRSQLCWLEGDGPGAWVGVRTIGAAEAQTSGVGDSAAAVDFDGDGDLDVVVGRLSVFVDDGLGWHENLGGERFGPYRPIGGTPDSASRLSVGDLDDDGDGDILFAWAGTSPAWMRNDGTSFAPPALLAHGNQDLAELRAADLDGDGRSDIFYAARFSAWTRFARGLGAGSWALPVDLANPGVTAGGLDASDVDGDGDLDVLLALRTPGELLLIENLGATTFAPPVTVTALPDVTVGLALADLDGDGRDDVLTVSGTGPVCEVRMALGAGTFSPPVAFPVALPLDPGTDVGADDLDGDGDLDPWVAGVDVEWLENDGAGGLSEAEPFGFGVRPILGAAVGDVDGDGSPELVAAEPGRVIVVEDAGTGRARGEFLSAGLVVSDGPEVVDVDGDGDDDVLLGRGSFGAIAASVAWLENDGGLQPPTGLWIDVADSGARVRSGDANGDGVLDVLVAHRGAFGVADTVLRWLVQGPVGTFAEAPALATDEVEVVGTPDLNGDGRSDVLALRGGGAVRDVVWCATDAAGALAPPVVLAAIPSGAFASGPVAAGDIDGDGDQDVAVLEYAGGKVAVCRNDGTGTFDTPVTLVPEVGIPAHRVALADLNDDGSLDVLVETDAGLVWHPGNGNGTYQPRAFVPRSLPSWPATSLVVADVDGDFDADLLRATPRGFSVQVNLERVGRGSCPNEAVGSNGLRPRTFATGGTEVSANDLVLRADRLVPGSFGIFIVGDAPDYAPLAGGFGTRCVGGALGRFYAGNGALQADASGRVALPVDLASVPTPFGFESIAAGETRWFQFWTRDAQNGVVSSNFSSALEVHFR